MYFRVRPSARPWWQVYVNQRDARGIGSGLRCMLYRLRHLIWRQQPCSIRILGVRCGSSGSYSFHGRLISFPLTKETVHRSYARTSSYYALQEGELGSLRRARVFIQLPKPRGLLLIKVRGARHAKDQARCSERKNLVAGPSRGHSNCRTSSVLLREGSLSMTSRLRKRPPLLNNQRRWVTLIVPWI